MMVKKVCVYMVPSSVSGLVHIYIYVYVCDDMCIRTCMPFWPLWATLNAKPKGTRSFTSQPFHGMFHGMQWNIKPTPENWGD